MGRVKWNTYVNSKDTNLNEVQKNPPDCLKNTMPGGGYMRNPFNSSMADQLATLNSRPPANNADVVAGQPGRSSREGTFDYTNMPAPAGMPKCGWPGNPTDGVDGRTQIGIASNLTDIPSVFGRKFTSQK